jgi:cytochrome bd-type quinol oxidase subunit 2
MKNLVRFLTILFTVLPLSALLLNLFQLSVKIKLSKVDYQVVQNIFGEFPWLFMLEIAALGLTISLVIWERKKKRTFILLLIASVFFFISILLFFIYILPTNAKTSNWTNFPADWEDARSQWEYSNAIRAILNLIGFSFLILSLLKNRYYYRVGVAV